MSTQVVFVEGVLREVRERPVLWITAVLMAWIFVKRLLVWYRLRHIDGPFVAKFTDFWMLKRLWTSELYVELGKLHEQYGKLIWQFSSFTRSVCADVVDAERRCCKNRAKLCLLQRPGRDPSNMGSQVDIRQRRLVSRLSTGSAAG